MALLILLICMYAYVTSGFVLATIACGSLKEPSKDERNGYFWNLKPITFFRSSMIHGSKLTVPCWWTRLRDAFVVNQPNLAAWMQRLQPLSLSAKIFLHHRQRLRFAFASQIRSITRTSSTNQFKHTWDQSKTTESTAERQLVDPSIFTLASDSGCFLVLSSCVICVPVCDKHNPKAHKAMETQKHYGPTNKISACAYESQCHFCIHLVRASRRAQTGIVWNCAISSVGGRTTETQSNSVTEQMSEKFTLLLVLAQAIR